MSWPGIEPKPPRGDSTLEKSHWNSLLMDIGNIYIWARDQWRMLAIIKYFLQLRYQMFLFFADDVGDQLCERVLGVLYEIWLIACVKSFPNPTLWKTFREMCMNWRHRTGITLAVFRIHEIFIRIRIRVYVSPDPALFFNGFQDANNK